MLNILKEIKHKLFGYWEKEFDLLFVYCKKIENENKELKDLLIRVTTAAEEVLKSK